MATKRTSRKQPNKPQAAKTVTPQPPDESERKRATEAERTKRIDTIVGFLLSGTRRSEILEFSRVQWYIERAQTDEYIAEATAVIKAESADERKDAIDKAIGRRLKYIQRATAKEDFRTALASDQDLCKLLALYPSESPKPLLNIDLDKLTNEQLGRIVNGEDPLSVLAGASGSEVETPPAPSDEPSQSAT